MKKKILALLALLGIATYAYARTNNNVYVMPTSGNAPTWGQVNLSSSAAITNTLPHANGGSDATTLSGAFSNFWDAFVTAAGTIVQGGTGGIATALPIGTAGQHLAVNSTATALTYVSITPPFYSVLPSTGTQTGILFTITTASVASGCVYSSNANNFTVLGSISSPTTLLFTSGTGAPSASGTLTYVSGGSGCNSAGNLTFSAEQILATYTTPTGALYLEIEGVGGGGGGQGSATTNAAGNGGITAFGINSAYGLGGYGGGANSGAPSTANGLGGLAGLGSLNGIAIAGSQGGYGATSGTGTDIGGCGGTSPFGGAGCTGSGGSGLNGQSAIANSGSGGGGATGSAVTTGGGGGGSGGSFSAIIPNPIATYYYTIAAGGALGTGTANGGTGATGIIKIRVGYQ